MAAPIPSIQFNDGTKIPVVGMGCWMGSVGGGNRVYDMCTKAIKHGYRHFDTATGYGNEVEVGKAIRDSGIPRSEFYVTTKLPNTMHHKVKEAFEMSLKELDIEYIDLWLMHWPQAVMDKNNPSAWDGACLRPHEHPTIVDTWKDMEKVLETGKVRSIGVSNFSIKTLTELLPHCTVIPVTNQIEVHPCLPSNDLKQFCEEKGIIVTAYSPLGRPSPESAALFEHAVIKSIAEAHSITPAQVALNWGVQRNTIVVPKSENDERMLANITLTTLSPDEMEKIDKIHKEPGFHRSLLTYHTPDGAVFGWTYEELGWNLKVGGIVDE